jgi:hypothetical protein
LRKQRLGVVQNHHWWPERWRTRQPSPGAKKIVWMVHSYSTMMMVRRSTGDGSNNAIRCWSNYASVLSCEMPCAEKMALLTQKYETLLSSSRRPSLLCPVESQVSDNVLKEKWMNVMEWGANELINWWGGGPLNIYTWKGCVGTPSGVPHPFGITLRQCGCNFLITSLMIPLIT